jgi:hypothetical protein
MREDEFYAHLGDVARELVTGDVTWIEFWRTFCFEL